MFDTFHIFALADMTQIEAVYTECCNTTAKDQFFSIYKTGIAHEADEDRSEQSHHFLTIDPYNPELAKRFRKDFDKLILYPQPDEGQAAPRGKKRCRK